MNFSAVIFDLDGTVLDNEDIYSGAFTKVLKKHGIDHKNEKQPQILGIGLDANWQKMKSQHPQLKNIDVTQLVHETQDIYHSKVKEILIRPGFLDLHQALTDEGIGVDLATSNNWWLVEDELEDLDLHKYFLTIVTGEEVINGKPSPDIFLLAARKLDVDPEECVVIEDSPAGVIAGIDAGMKVIAILNNSTQEEDFPKADVIVSGFEEITPRLLQSLFLS